jgi:hypothetical protein
MNQLREQLEALVQHRTSPSISIYMPMELAGPAVEQNPIRFKNLIKKASELLGAENQAMIAPLEELLTKESFWEERAPGLAVFHSREGTRVLRLPTQIEPLAVVEDRFHLKPVLALLAEPGRFHVLALSQHATRLLEVTRGEVRELPGLPGSIHATLPAESTRRQLQYHTGGGDAPIYHGQGVRERREDEDLRRFLRAVSDAVDEAIADKTAPLVLAGVEEITSAFRELSAHPNIVAESIEGNVETLSNHELEKRAQAVAKRKLEESYREAHQRVVEHGHTDRVISSIADIVRAASDGRIDTLFVPKDERRWGTFDAATREVSLDDEQTEANVDLLDLAAVRTFDQGGSVFVVDRSKMPQQDESAVAMLRY